MSRFIWIRHAPTHAKTMVGWSDLPADLSDKTRLVRLSEYLPENALVISSDLQRARATADHIAGARTRLPDDPGLREIHFGRWELQSFDTVPEQDQLRAYWETPGEIRAPAGESWNDITARVNGSVERLRLENPGRDIAVVAHFGAILTQVQRALKISAYEAFAHRIDNLSVTELAWKSGSWQPEMINHIP